MKLYYYKDPAGNFGDDLNPWLWPKLLPDVFDEDTAEWFVGIGTLLNHRLPSDGRLHIFGSGVGYGEKMRQDAAVKFHAVRGFKSAHALGLPPELAVTDAAVLLRKVDVPAPARVAGRIGVMLTGASLERFDWQSVCDRAGMVMISCHWSVDRVLAEIQSCDLLLTEAMHGAIVADTLRVPWTPITCSNIVLAFKWEDWLSTLSLSYVPEHIEPLFALRAESFVGARLKARIKQTALSWGLLKGEFNAESTRAQVDTAVRQLLAAAQRKPQLSEDRIVVGHVNKYMEIINRFRDDRK
jgi:succinoglycan biosynthesis protein ExoV